MPLLAEEDSRKNSLYTIGSYTVADAASTEMLATAEFTMLRNTCVMVRADDKKSTLTEVSDASMTEFRKKNPPPRPIPVTIKQATKNDTETLRFGANAVLRVAVEHSGCMF